MKTFIVRYKSGEQECVKATSMYSTSTAVLFRSGKNLNAIIPLSEIIQACDSKSVTKWKEMKIKSSVNGFYKRLRAAVKSKPTETDRTRSSK